MTLELTRFCFTIGDFDRMIEAGILDETDRVELVEGEIVQMSPICRCHPACVDRPTRILGSFIGDSAQLRVQGPISLDDTSEVQPDLAILRRSSDYYASAHPTSGDVLLLVEVADSSVGVDRRVKVPLYARHGVEEVWLIDLKASLVTIDRDPSPTGYATILDVGSGGWLSALAFPNREIAVSNILG